MEMLKEILKLFSDTALASKLHSLAVTCKLGAIL